MTDLHRGRRKRGALAGLALTSAGALALAGLSAITTASEASPSATASQFSAGRYVVVLRQPGAAAYKGGTAGLAPTSPTTTGRAFRATADATREYTNYIAQRQTSVASSVGADIDTRYTTAINGFAADLTHDQALELSQDRRVLLVEKDSLQHVDGYETTPDYFGLTGNKGLWRKEAGGQKKAGSGVVIGVLDTGIWPESQSFKGAKLSAKPTGPWDATEVGGATRMEKSDGTLFTGECQAGEEFTADTCSTKIIGARYYDQGFLDQVGSEDAVDDYFSPRDGGGHGSHTASTAAGDPVAKTKVVGTTYRNLSGMAPGAAIAAYKVCWTGAEPGEDDDGCTTSDILAAIDDAIADNVDVINFSVGGGASPTIGADDLAYEGAAEAGIFVAASAGNSGPDATTLDHAGPWLTTVAASTSYAAENTVKLGNGVKLAGASLAGRAVPSTSLVDSAASGLPDAEDADLCAPDSLDPEKVTGKIVVCLRGVYARTDKSLEVKRAGGIAMVLVNPSPNSLDADAHEIPTIHLDDVAGKKVYDYLASAGSKATASFILGNKVSTTAIPQVAGFSSRGPSEVAGGDILKPDIAAPGVSVLAAVAPPTNHGRDYDFYSGTSMAAPHIAGLAAFLQGEHPKWSPMQIKSAMMTTATNTRTEDGKANTDVFAQGAGEVDPAKFFDPGLFVTSTAQEWKGFLADQGYDTGVAPIGANEINTPALAEGSASGPVSFTRTFRANRTGTWTISSSVPGFTLKTSPGRITSKRVGDLITVTFNFTRTDAPLAEYATGYVSLNGPTKLRLPVALRPVAVDAPAEVSGTGTTGSTKVDITPGITGTLPLKVTGLAKAQSVSDAVATGDDYLECVTVPADTSFARFDLDAADANADLDMYVYLSTSCDPADITAEAGTSATSSSDERLDLVDPEAGTYIVDVNGYAAGSSGSPIPFRLDSYVMDPSATLGAFTASPNPVPVTATEPTSFTVSWTGLDAGARYLGLVDYDGSLSPTAVTVDTTS